MEFAKAKTTKANKTASDKQDAVVEKLKEIEKLTSIPVPPKTLDENKEAFTNAFLALVKKRDKMVATDAWLIKQGVKLVAFAKDGGIVIPTDQ